MSEQDQDGDNGAGANDDIEAMLAGLEAAAGDESGEVAQEKPEFDIPLDAALNLALSAGFAILAPAWKVSAPEIEQLATVYAALIEKYVSVGEMGPELAAVAVTAMVFGPRMRTPRKDEPEESSGKAA